jgi:tetratricopeptide (TPR) repeat protein
MVTNERARAPGKPQLAGAMCDIAMSIGDGVMLQHCTDELERIAPNYAPTRHARAALAAGCPPWRFWGGWLAIAIAAAVTMAHAGRRWLARPSLRMPRAGAAGRAAIVLGIILTASSGAQAQTEHMLSKWPVDDNDPESSVPTEAQRNAEPLEAGYWLQDLTYKAGRAVKRGDHEQAAKYYKAMYKMVPNRAISLRKLCDEEDALGKLEEATAACAGALVLDGVTVGDYSHYVRLVLRKPGALTDKDVAALTNVLNHMKDDPEGHATGIHLECEVGARIADVAMLKECTTALAATAPDDPGTLSYEWALAVRQGHVDEAHRLMDRAKAAGLNDAVLKSMETEMVSNSRREIRRLLTFGVGFVIFVCAAAFFVRSRRRAVPLAA